MAPIPCCYNVEDGRTPKIGLQEVLHLECLHLQADLLARNIEGLETCNDILPFVRALFETIWS